MTQCVGLQGPPGPKNWHRVVEGMKIIGQKCPGDDFTFHSRVVAMGMGCDPSRFTESELLTLDGLGWQWNPVPACWQWWETVEVTK